MAKKLHLVHVKSSVADKAPSASTLNYGEIAINYNSETPAIYIRDDEDQIVKFIAEPYFEKIVGTGITENDGVTITPLSEVIEQDEVTVSAALNELNNSKADISYVDELVSSVTITIDGELDSASTNPVENRVLYEIITDDEEAIAAALNDLNEKKSDKDYVDSELSGITNSLTRKADISYVDNAVSSITIDVDSQLDSASTNPVENRVIYQVIADDEEAIAIAIGELDERKTDKDYVDGNYLPLSGGTLTGGLSGTTVSADTFNAQSGFFQTSDERFKIFMGDINDTIEKVFEIPTKYFYWRNMPDGPVNIGTSAQKVQEVFPELVKEENDKLSVDYAKLSIVALAAIKELVVNFEKRLSTILPPFDSSDAGKVLGIDDNGNLMWVNLK